MQDVAQLNRVLGSAGLATLGEPGLMAQLGYLVEDHEHFRQLLTKCQPELRRDMYEALRPYLRFSAKPLDVYLAESAQVAESHQWPIQDAEGNLRPYTPPEVGIAQRALDEAMAREHLTLTCVRCTRVETFSGLRKGDVIQAARLAGWTYGLDAEGNGREICPEC